MNAVVYCLYGSNDMYTHGAVSNAAAVAEMYPGWTMAVYHDDTVPAVILERLGGFDHVKLIDRSGDCWKDGQRMLWRFLALDPAAGFERMISRDCDSRIYQREAVAVQRWIESGQIAHAMHDSISHDVELMGGMCGFKCLWPMVESAIDRWLCRHHERPGYGWDQAWLREIVWPAVCDDTLYQVSSDLDDCCLPPTGRHVGCQDGPTAEERKFLGLC